MYVCLDCQKTFQNPIKWTETHGLSSPPYEHLSGCPYCHGAYVETYQCDCCGQWITTDDYIKTNDGLRYCDNCYTRRDLGDEN